MLFGRGVVWERGGEWLNEGWGGKEGRGEVEILENFFHVRPEYVGVGVGSRLWELP